jgi:hypothetical protein
MDILHSLLQIIIYTCVFSRAIIVVNKVNHKVYSNTLEAAQHSQNKCPSQPGWVGTYFGNTLLLKGITQCKVPGRKLMF